LTAAYVKLFKVVSDFALGKQTYNQGLDNNQALRDQFNINHSTGIGGGAYGDPFLGPGRHDDSGIARTVADFQVDPNSLACVPLLVSGQMIYASPRRIKAGQWRVYVTTPRLFGAVATVKVSGASLHHATARINMLSGGPFVTVSTWDLSLNPPEQVDLPFSLVLWAEAVA
jgi:hypothetical protein